MVRLFLLAVAATCLVGFSSAAVADDQTPAGKPALDKAFVEKAVPCCTATIQMAELAEKQATRPEVKTFAKKLVKEHKELRQELATAAKDEKVNTPSVVEKTTREEIDRLAKMQGASFDQAFLDRMVEDHEKAIKACQAQADQGTDASLKAFAKNCVTELQTHLKEAKALGGKSKAKDTDRPTEKNPGK